MKGCILFTFMLLAVLCNAQESVKTDTTKSFVTYGPEPSFPGGLEKFYQYVQNEIEAMGLSGTHSDPAWVKFLVNKEGKIIKVIILESPDKGYENAILDMFENMPQWIPAKRNDEFVISEMTLPIFFNK